MRHESHPRRKVVSVRVMVLAGLAVVLALALSGSFGAASNSKAASSQSHHSMTEAGMKQMAASWFASHPRVGTPSVAPPSAFVNVGNFYFDADNNLATAVDTVKIQIGQTVQWNWVAGTHTVTNGTDSGDPNAGTLFNEPVDPAHTQYSHTFNSAGLVPYFCAIHEFSMTGFVKVSDPLGVEPRSDRALGFTTSPSPNPTRSGVSFQFALREAGHARIEALDATGRLVDMVLNRDLASGSHTAAWDGRNASGKRASPGIYYLRLQVPGFTDTRRIVIR